MSIHDLNITTDEEVMYYGDNQVRWYQLACLHQTEDLFINKNAKRICINLPTGCHQKGTEILMYNGSLKKVEDIVVNDLLMGPDGTSRRVLSLHTGRQEMAKIVPKYGEPFVVNMDHILSLVETGSQTNEGRIDISVREYISQPDVIQQQYCLYFSTNFNHVDENTKQILSQRMEQMLQNINVDGQFVTSAFEVIPMPEDEYYGFVVDHDHLYVMGNFVVTHNCGKTLTSGIIFNSPALRHWMGLSNEFDANGVYKEKLRVLFVAMNHRLLTQAERTFALANGVELILQSAFSDIPINELERGWHLTVIEEAHHESTSTIQFKLDKMTSSTTNHLGFIPVIGLTATYERPDGFLVKFDHIVSPISRDQAVKEGWLAPTELYSYVDPTRGDNKCELVTDMFSRYHQEMGRGLVFLRTKEEVEYVSQFIKSLGYKVANINDMSKTHLNQVLDEFSKGKWDYVVNCNKLGEGIDVKGCECVVIGRTVGSYPLLNQIIGRAARPDTICRVYELINPFNARNLDTTVVVGTPTIHKLRYKRGGKWVEQDFNPVTDMVDDEFKEPVRRFG